MNDGQFNSAAVVKWIVAACIAQWVQVPWVMRALIFLMAIDYFTGMLLAFKHKRVSSEVGFYGLYKKGLIIVLLVSANLFEKALGTDLHLEQVGALAYCANEFISILENCANSGVPIPQPLVAALLNVKGFGFQKATEEQMSNLRSADETLNVERSEDLQGESRGKAKK